VDVEHELFALVQRVAALEANSKTNAEDINNLGNSVRGEIKAKVDDGVAPKVENLDKAVFKAQIYIAATLAIVGGIAVVLQYVLSIFGIQLSDISLKGK
jgi:hypothetical protein